MQIIPNLCSYDPKSCNFKVFMLSTLSMLKTLKNGKVIAKKSLFAMKKILTHKNLKVVLSVETEILLFIFVFYPILTK